MRNKTWILAMSLFLALPSHASEAPKRAPALQSHVYQPGEFAIIQNSLDDWNDKVVMITDVFEDGSVRVRMDDGTRSLVRKTKLEISLSPALPCMGTDKAKICENDKVYYPSGEVTMGIPSGSVEHVFANGKVLLRDGLHRIANLKDIGKETSCSPQKETICEGDYVMANGLRQNRQFSFEGPVEKVYTNGIVIVRSDHLWRYPIHVNNVVKRVATTNAEMPAGIISSRDVKEKIPSERVMPEIRTEDEYYDPNVLPAY